jgi:nucleotide-binding universal stress UspA family protein
MLICSDGHASADHAIRFIGRTAAAGSAEVTLFGIVEHPDDESALGEALQRGARVLRDEGVKVEVVTRNGQPIEQIKKRTQEETYDLVVVGAERKTSSPFALSTKAYHIIKGIDPPVLVMIGKRTELRRLLVCSGGQPSMERTLELTASIARGAGAAVTLVHVMAAPPLIYSELLEREISGVEKLLASNSALGRNLRREKASFEKRGVAAEVKLRSGEVVAELLREARAGDLTASIVDGADCAVLVVRNAVENPYWKPFRRLIRALKGKLQGVSG